MSQGEGASQEHHEGEEQMTKAQRKRERQSGRRARHGSLEMISDGDAPTNRTKPTEDGGSERPRMPPLPGEYALPLPDERGSWWVFCS